MLSSKFLNEYVSIHRIKTESDKFGGVEKSFDLLSSSVRTRVYSMSGRVERDLNGEKFRPTRRMIFVAGTDIRVADKIEMSDGTMWQAVAIFPYSSQVNEHHVTVEIVSIGA